MVSGKATRRPLLQHVIPRPAQRAEESPGRQGAEPRPGCEAPAAPRGFPPALGSCAASAGASVASPLEARSDHHRIWVRGSLGMTSVGQIRPRSAFAHVLPTPAHRPPTTDPCPDVFLLPPLRT